MATFRQQQGSLTSEMPELMKALRNNCGGSYPKSFVSGPRLIPRTP